MALVPAGEFLMGSNDGESDAQPAHPVSLDAFWLDRYEVTTARYAEFLKVSQRDQPAEWDKVLPSHGKKPVIGVNWEDAEAYCTWAGKRLPTEAEWEKAARGTEGRKYPWGDAVPTDRLANYGKRAQGNVYHEVLKPVGSYEAGKSPEGVYDLAGNVWEWVADWYDSNYYAKSPARNPKGPADGSGRVLRGGSWGNEPSDVRSAGRLWTRPMYRYAIYGFRCAQDAR
ncbi:MAG: formylglycine-generating enzyme family protein [Nitrospirae bacterium]|nr:formylglycine-generating enzyme family protein [Nitrospirota bacterium]